MIIIKDSMVIIHMAQMGLLKICREYFGIIAIPTLVETEVLEGIKAGYPDAFLVRDSIREGTIKVIPILDNLLVKKANQYNIQRGEAEVVALYWQEKAELLATDDDNVRKKKEVLSLNLIGTPAILLRLFRDKKISVGQYSSSVKKLRAGGWFSSYIYDILSAEVQDA